MAKQSLAQKLRKAKKALKPYDAGYKNGIKEGVRRVMEGIEYKRSGGDGYIGSIGIAKKKKFVG